MAKAGYGKAREGHANYDWYEMLRQYKAFKDAFHRNPKSSGASAEEMRLYYWMYNQTRLILTGHISDEHYNALKKSGVDIPNKGNLDDTYTRKVKAFAKSEPMPGTKAYLWAMAQSRAYNMYNLAEWRLNIWKEQKVSLERLERFGTKAHLWVMDIDQYASCSKAERKQNKYLGKFVKRQIELYYNGELYDWQKKYLEDKGLIEIKYEVAYSCTDHRHSECLARRFEQYQAFIKENGRAPGQKNKEERSLYFWGRGEVKQIRKGNRSQIEIAALATLGLIA
ncbi:MAG: hypothetical protein K6G10_07020 [Butyrivibrio sp.]|nr:hypothetical protein [Butyrivibrio sp.]